MKKKWYNIILSIFTGFLFIICGLFLIASIIVIINSKTKPDEVPDIFGYKPLIVLSGSMETEIHAGDLAIVKEVKPEELKKQDIIAFMNEDGTITTHRIIDIIEEDNETKFITKGDNNNVEDKHMVTFNEVEGLYLFKMRGFGNIFMFIQKPLGLITSLLIILVIGVLVLYLTNNKKTLTEEELKEFEEYKKLKKKDIKK